MHKSQVFGYLLISFLAGIFIGKFFSDTIMATLWFVLAGTIILAASAYERTFAKTKKAERHRRAGVIAGLCILAAGFGVFRYGQADLNQSVLSTFVREAGGKGIPALLHGYVDGEVQQNGTKAQFVFHVTELEVPGHTVTASERTLVFTQPSAAYHIGDTLKLLGSLQLPQNSSEFDYIQYLKNKEIRTTISYPKIAPDASVSLSIPVQAKISVYRWLFDVKDRFQNAVARVLPEPHAAYINGVLLGTRQNIPGDIAAAFNKTGTTHILAISGYNITIISEALLAVLVFWMRRRHAFWVSVGVIILFTIMTGAGASVVRAAVMGLLLLFANSYGRLYDPRNSILFAAAVMIFLDPLALRFDVGFQLSFLAVLGLLYIYPILEKKFEKFPKAWGLKETALMSISAQAMVAPLLAYTFHSFSVVSIPANLLVLPFMPYVMLFGFLTGVGALIAPPLGQAIGFIAWVLSAYQLHIIGWFGSLQFASITVVISSFALIGIYGLLIFGVWSLYKKSEPRT